MNKGKKGFTLIEILISLAIASIVMAAAYTMYIAFFKQTASQGLLVEAQQNARAGIDIMQKEFINAGYRVPGGTDSVVIADAHAFQFRYVDPDPASNTYGQGLKVKYGTVQAGGVAYLYKTVCTADTGFTNECTNGASADYQHKVIAYLKDTDSLSFQYFNAEGTELTGTPLDAAKRADVRFLKVTLTTVTKSKLPDTNATKTVQVNTEIRLRNIGISTSAAGTSKPAKPTGLQAREVEIGTRKGICGQLKVRWDKGSEGNLAGYYISYTLGGTSDSNVVSASLSKLNNCPDGKCTYTLVTEGASALKCSESDGNPVNTYIINVAAFDTNFTQSDPSDPVSGNPATSYYDFAAGENDTTINPSKPLAVTSFTAKDGPADGQVELSWSYDKTNNPDLTGFRIYRSTRPFASSDYPLSSTTDITLVAAEKVIEGVAKIDASATSYLDKGLSGCTTYYYAIAPVNCDETLISAADAIENGDNTKYVPAEYRIAYGDGADGIADFPDGCDTTPNDQIDPPAPSLVPYAGWKRVFLKMQNPNLDTTGDFAYSLLYVNRDGICPKVDEDGVLSNGFPVPNSDMGVAGRFKTPDVVDVNYLTHVEMCNNLTCSGTTLNGSTPRLDNNTVYCYLAVSFDKCGNHTPIEQVVTTLAEMCGDDPVGSPGDGSKGEIWPAGTTPITITGCDSKSGLAVNWQTMNHTYPNGYFDGALYRVHMKLGDAFDFGPGYDPQNPATLITYAQAPNSVSSTLSSGTITSGISDGQSYSFGVVATDCVYENDTAGHPNNYSGWLTKSDITPGRISRDEKANTDRDSHREVLTGVTLTNIEPYSSPTVEASMEAADNLETSYKHNTVTVFFENTQANTGTSDNNMVIQKLSLSWTNPSAFLRSVSIGDGKSGLIVSSTSIDNAASNAITNDPYVRGVSNYDITDAVIPGGTRWVPITFEFRDGSGNPIDMRDDQLLLTLNIENASTNTTTCESYLTISGNVEFSGIPVPIGPTVNSVSQSNPSSSGFAVPGESGLASVPVDGTYNPTRQADGGQDVIITAYVNEQDAAVSSTKLYWTDTPITQGTAPTLLASYHVVPMTKNGFQWSGTIKNTDVTSLPRRIWYYIVTEDSDGNYDRAPEMKEGHYTFDWKPFNVCDVTPSAPTGVGVGSDGVSMSWVSVKWQPVTKYTNGQNINTLIDPITYQVWRRYTSGGAFAKIADVPWNAPGYYTSFGPIAPSAYSDYIQAAGYFSLYEVANMLSYDFTYYIVAKNSCSATGNASAESARFSECQGSTSSLITVNPASITSGGTYGVTVNDCQLGSTPPYDTTVNTITVKNVSSSCGINYDLNLTETAADSGTFTGNVGTTRSTTDSSKVCVSAGDITPDQITVSCPGCNGPPATKQVTVKAAACDNDPQAATGLSGSVPSTGPDRDAAVILSWTASASPDRAKYRIFRKIGAIGTFSQVAEVVESASGTITYRDYIGKSSLTTNNYYYYVVAVDSCATDPYTNGRVSAQTSTVGPF